ncbi:DUF4175 family protein [Roseivirga sp. BDSF3-8]|uniref:DUF4175 family protein n=1 Tax=Roseivirga sp. BDSF3-8 TaxID=3241598 RepID=UPI0035318B31
MSQPNSIQTLLKKLREYKKKYYLNKLLKGSIVALALLLTAFLFANSVDYGFKLPSAGRTVLVGIFIVITAITLVWYVIRPAYKLLTNERQLSNRQAAQQIGHYFPDISDKLLNTLQLAEISDRENALVQASIRQRTKEITVVPFTSAVNYGENKRYLRYVIAPAACILIIMLFVPQLFTESTPRLIRFNTELVEEAPFSFGIPQDLRAFRNEDYELAIDLQGSSIPENAYIELNGRRIKMKPGNQTGRFTHTFTRVKQDLDFSIEAAGFSAGTHSLEVVDRPDLKNFDVSLNYPAYLGLENKRLTNVGNLQVPEGTKIKWIFSTLASDEMEVNFSTESNNFPIKKDSEEIFEIEKQVFETQSYDITLKNEFSENKEKIRYTLDVIKDKSPQITLETLQDTVLFNYLIVGGNISDDYGISDLALYYRLVDQRGKTGDYERLPLSFDRNSNNQSYYYQWLLDSLAITEGSSIEYFVQVRDNDAIHGRKATRTGVYKFAVPERRKVNEDLEKADRETQKKTEQTLDKVEDLQKKIEDASNRLKGKNNLNWQDKKAIEELIEKREEIEKELEQLKEKAKNEAEKRSRFNEQDKELAEKAEQLQELMEELLDDETKKLYEELQKLLEENMSLPEFQEQLEQIDNKEQNLKEELERTLELFKRMKMENKMDQTIQDLDEMVRKQEELREKTEEKNSESEELQQEQEELNQEFDQLKEDMEELQEMNQELKRPKSLPDNQEQQQQISEEMKKAAEELQKNKKNKASQNQKNSSQKMEQMKKSLQQMQNNMQMSQMQENLGDLRQIVDNLIQLSFDQENLLSQFRKISQSDPRFVELSQGQLKLEDDAEVIKDSLQALSERVFQLSSFITREMGDMNKYMKGSMDALKERDRGKALSEQQFAMTSMNNLALMLDDVLQQMQQQMADAMGMPQKQQGQQSQPSLSNLQQQLNNQINQLKKSGKSGRELSEELAKLAAEQERIRKALQQQMQNGGSEAGGKAGEEGENGTNGMKPVLDKMEESEIDLVNKQLTEETINRQKEILTRLLEAEESMRERETEKERKSETGKQYAREVPKAFEEYIRNKEKEIELLKTIPPRLNPYYKEEVNKYFERINNK